MSICRSALTESTRDFICKANPYDCGERAYYKNEKTVAIADGNDINGTVCDTTQKRVSSRDTRDKLLTVGEWMSIPSLSLLWLFAEDVGEFAHFEWLMFPPVEAVMLRSAAIGGSAFGMSALEYAEIKITGPGNA